eukprot:TRINITY_DN9695_c0_g1_i1.p1 TRINITY_DN9695_c0_g1~~TRINITY_DN9695_c0_g1_i1.p1  ORF type:complete len:265 (+),score=54.08 TRINITY_DN9695_c0_g1_i1:902-1696(+)
MLSRALWSGARLTRGKRTPNPYLEKTDLSVRYGNYVKYFIEDEDSNVKYVDTHDKSKKVIDFQQGVHARFRPRIATEAWVAPNAVVSGRLEMWSRASLWYGVVVRADTKLVRIGYGTNIQDHTVIHEAYGELSSNHDGSTVVGHHVTVGHNCILNACTIEDRCIIGSNSKLMPGSYVEKFSQLGAGSVLEGGQRVPSGQLWAGAPAKYIRDLTDREKVEIVGQSEAYFEMAQLHSEAEFLDQQSFTKLEDAGVDLQPAKRNFPW